MSEAKFSSLRKIMTAKWCLYSLSYRIICTKSDHHCSSCYSISSCFSSNPCSFYTHCGLCEP